MSTSRRKFLKAGMVAALFAAVPLKNVFGQSWKDRDGNPEQSSNPQDPLANYTKATFTQYLNSVFQLRTGFSVVAVTLLQVGDMPAPKDGECFSLLFRGGSNALRQDTYTLEHPSLGTFQLLLVPVGTDQNGAQGYLATINRLSYLDVLNNTAPKGSSTKRSGSIQPAGTPTPTATPAPVSPSPVIPPPAQPTTPTTTPQANPKPVRKRKRSRKRNNRTRELSLI